MFSAAVHPQAGLEITETGRMNSKQTEHPSQLFSFDAINGCQKRNYCQEQRSQGTCAALY
jgi:hypothetical protein